MQWVLQIENPFEDQFCGSGSWIMIRVVDHQEREEALVQVEDAAVVLPQVEPAILLLSISTLFNSLHCHLGSCIHNTTNS